MLTLIISILINPGIIFSSSAFDTSSYNRNNNTYGGYVIITDDLAM